MSISPATDGKKTIRELRARAVNAQRPRSSPVHIDYALFSVLPA